MKIQKIPVNFNKLRKVVHLADIHIRLFKRHSEYRKCFAQLYKDIASIDLSECVIFVGGDLVHAKTDMSPEMVSLASEFLHKLADIAPTLLIAGNHDLNLANISRLDSLSPLVENLKHPNLHYLKDSGIYQVADTQFAVYSVIGDKANWPVVTELTAENKIALFHGPVNNAQTDTGFTITNRHVTNTLFDGYDMVMLGDIHKHQVLQEYDRKKNIPIMVYPGSLIQQSYGESLENHGWCEWNILNREFVFHELKNLYGYYTITIRDNKMPTIPELPENVRLRLFVHNVNGSTIKKLMAILRKEYNVQEFIVNRIPDSILHSKSDNGSVEMVDVHNLNTQNELISKYLEEHFSVTDSELLKKITSINEALNSKIQDEDFSRNIRWKPLRFEFSNMFSYGPNNVINFENMKGVYGLFSPNASGKTSTFDAMMFCLYDKTPRAFKASHIMNNRKSKFDCYLKFEINGLEYGIKRTGVRKKDGDVKVDVEFWRIETDGTKTSLNGDDRRDTDANIRSYVGNYEDFILTNLSVQNNSAIFIDKGQSERKDLLGQFMGINVFDKLYTFALDEMKEVVGALKKFNKEPLGTTLANTQNEIDRLTKQYNNDQVELEKYKTKLTELTNKISSLYESKTPISIGNVDIKKLENKKAEVLSQLKDLNASLLEANSTYNSLILKQNELKNKIRQYESSKIEEKHDELDKLSKKKSAILHDLKVLDVQIKNDEDKLKKLSEHKYDPNCVFCMNNIFVKDALKTKDNLKLFLDRKIDTENQRQSVEVSLRTLGDVSKYYEDYLSIKESLLTMNNEIFKLSSKNDLNKTSIGKAETSLKNTNEQIREYYDSIDIIQQNSAIDEKIFKFEQEAKEIGVKSNFQENNLRSLHGELQVLKTVKSDILKSIRDAEELEKTHHAYEYYIEAVNRDGIPYELISKVIPSIEAEINNVLTQIVDFTVALEIDGKNINGKIVYDYDRVWPLELSSGMERFISSLAIRVALINVSNLPKSNFLIIDEGLGTLSAENLISMNMMFSILKNQFDFLVVISHLDTARDMVESLIEIRRENGYSYINY